MNGYDAQDAINNPPHGEDYLPVLDYADGQAKQFKAGHQAGCAATAAAAQPALVKLRGVAADIRSRCVPANPFPSDQVSATYALMWADGIEAAIALLSTPVGGQE